MKNRRLLILDVLILEKVLSYLRIKMEMMLFFFLFQSRAELATGHVVILATLFPKAQGYFV